MFWEQISLGPPMSPPAPPQGHPRTCPRASTPRGQAERQTWYNIPSPGQDARNLCGEHFQTVSSSLRLTYMSWTGHMAIEAVVVFSPKGRGSLWMSFQSLPL